MIAIFQLIIFGFIAMTLIYWIVSVYSRSVRREKLEKAFDSGEAMRNLPEDVTLDRDAYIETGMAAYEHGLKRRLIWLVYVIPTVVVAVTVYLVNYQ
jgi:hypothetical protein